MQDELFVIGSQLAYSGEQPPAKLPSLEESSIGRLEMEIDAATAALEPLRNFILPGGSEKQPGCTSPAAFAAAPSTSWSRSPMTAPCRRSSSRI